MNTLHIKNIIILNYLIISTLCFIGFSCAKDEITSTQADSFVKFYVYSGTNVGYDVKQTSDGGYAVVGSVSSGDSAKNVYLLKTDKFGNVLWHKTYGNKANDEGYSIQICDDGGFIILGYTTDTLASADENMYLVRTDENGDTLWTRSIGGSEDEEGYNVQILKNGGFVLAGYTESEGHGGKDAFIVIVDNNGNLIDKQTYGYSGDDVAKYVQETSDGFIFIGSTTQAASTDIYVVSTNSSLGANATLFWGTTDNDEGICFKKLPDGSYMGIGTATKADASASKIYMYPFTIDNNANAIIAGNSILIAKQGEEKNDIVSQLIISSNELVITGTRKETQDNQDYLFIKTDLTGKIITSNTYGATGLQYSRNIIQTNDNGFAIVGSNGYSGSSVISLLKLDTNGNLK